MVSSFSIQNMLSRDAFKARMDREQPIAIHELLVPILQGHDSVHLRTEIEIGGSDQLFNFTIARRMQELDGQKPQVSLMAPIIRGTDGRKMLKSFDNCIFLDGTPGGTFGACMSISDAVMDEEFIPLLTDLKTFPESPVLRKKAMAKDIVRQIHGQEAAERAQSGFENQVQKKEIPAVIKNIEAKDLIQAVVAVRDCSNSAARRLISEGGVQVEGGAVTENGPVESGQVVKVGKREFVKIL